MKFPPLDAFLTMPWPEIQPFYDALAERPLTAENVAQWLLDWTALSALADERSARLRLATNLHTTDPEIEAAFHAYLQEIFPHLEAADQRLKEKLLASGLEPEGFERPLMRMMAEAALFRVENIPLRAEESKMGTEFNKIAGGWTVEWEGREYTLVQLQPLYQPADRATRERLWRLSSERMLADRATIDALWARLLANRVQQAANAGYPGDYRAYRWQYLQRFDYTPADCRTFHQAIEAVAVPAATRLYEKRRRALGVDTLRPWDLDLEQGVSAFHQPPLRPYDDVADLEATCAEMFRRVDPALGAYFETMRRENLLDLENRKGKAPGAFCTTFEATERPFIFCNSVGLHDNVQTLLHEAGHAFHAFETFALPYYQQRSPSMEFAEVASMAMELLAAPYFTAGQGGFYTPKDAARARAEHLEGILLFWPYMAVVDSFQHWVYENPEAAMHAANCDAKWAELWARFIPGVDWSGLDEARKTGWHRKRHIHRYPFYYVEYGLAQLGAVQVWRNALSGQAGAVAAYRRGLALGGTVSTPELYAAAGAKFAFDAETLGEAMGLIEKTLARLEAVR